MHHHALAPVRRSGLQHIAILIDRDPIERPVQRVDKAVFRARPRRRVRSRMVEDGVRINPAIPAPQRVAQLHIAQRAAPPSPRREHERPPPHPPYRNPPPPPPAEAPPPPTPPAAPPPRPPHKKPPPPPPPPCAPPPPPPPLFPPR